MSKPHLNPRTYKWKFKSFNSKKSSRQALPILNLNLKASENTIWILLSQNKCNKKTLGTYQTLCFSKTLRL